jgi:hypothetical protein
MLGSAPGKMLFKLTPDTDTPPYASQNELPAP